MKILDGRDSFSQWDLNVKVTSNKFKVGDEIHFYNIRQPNALVVKAYLLDGKVVAEVPNILLQSAYPIFAYCMVDDAGATYTIKKYEFKVKQRPKPDDYVYTQTEVKTYDALVERMDEIEKNGVSDERIGQAVSDYLEENPVNVDLTGYATEKWVGDNYQPKGNYLTEHQDISGKLDTSELPTAINTALAQAKASGEFDGAPGQPGTPGKDGEDGKDYVLTESDKAEIAEMAAELVDVPDSGGNVDLTGYATEQYVKDYAQPKGEYLTEVPEGYAKTEDIPTKVSELDNDSGYLIEHQSLEGYAKTEDIPTKPEDIGAQPSGNYLTAVPDGYAKTEDIPTDAHINSLIDTKLSQFSNAEGVSF